MVAILAIVFHTVLSALAPLIAAPSVDPFTVICRSEATSPADQIPGHGPVTPAHACDHCNLCSAVAPPMPGLVLAAIVEPARVLQVLRPVSMVRHHAIAADPKLARGPPVFA